jgi:tRNA (cytidine/uridine-2'-O-)-methyltransferase
MFHIVLVEPEIPPNTGNIIRLSANTGCHLHLIEPMGFPLDDARMRRAGLDYHEFAEVKVHPNFAAFVASVKPNRIWAFSSKVKRLYTEATFAENDALVFGPETRGLSQELLQQIPEENKLTLPMRPHSRSLNLSNSVAVAVYEAWRQLDFQAAKRS